MSRLFQVFLPITNFWVPHFQSAESFKLSQTLQKTQKQPQISCFNLQNILASLTFFLVLIFSNFKTSCFFLQMLFDFILKMPPTAKSLAMLKTGWGTRRKGTKDRRKCLIWKIYFLNKSAAGCLLNWKTWI